MKWLKDKTYWLYKYNLLEIQKDNMEKTYTKEIMNLMKTIGELEANNEYYKGKNISYRKRIKELKEQVRK